jgi:hypothetical protein
LICWHCSILPSLVAITESISFLTLSSFPWFQLLHSSHLAFNRGAALHSYWFFWHRLSMNNFWSHSTCCSLLVINNLFAVLATTAAMPEPPSRLLDPPSKLALIFTSSCILLSHV